MADRYNTNHHEVIVEPDVKLLIEGLTNYVGEPFADSSILPTFIISRYIRQGRKVALSGDGGDELFGGYDDYLIAYRATQLQRRYPGSMARKLAVGLDKVFFRFDGRTENRGWYDEYLDMQPSMRLFRGMGFGFEEKRSLFKDDFMKDNGFAKKYLTDKWTGNNDLPQVEKLMRVSLSTRLLNDYLVKVDRASMKNSLEIRSPFLDKDLAEFAFTIPYQFKFSQNTSKYILRKIGQHYISEDILSRPKRGFSIPLGDWIRKDLPFVEQIVFDGGSKDLFSRKYVAGLLEDHKNGSDQSHKLWSLVCFQIWYQTFCG